MTKRMLIDALHPEETRVVIADERQIYDFDFTSVAKKQLKGNIYLAKITRVEPSLQAAFVEYGGGKQGFLPFGEIHPDYYQIPVSDRKRLLEEAESGEDMETGHAASSAMTDEEGRHGNRTPRNGMDESAEIDDGGESAQGAGFSSTSGLPMLEAIPEQRFDEEDTPPEQRSPAPDAPEAPARAPAESALAFNSSEIVSQETFEDSPLAGRLTDDMRASPESRPEASPAEEGVETLASEEEEAISSQRKRRQFSRRYKIQEVIKRGQIVLVQVIKEERGNKGVSLTSYLSLAGRYCVLMPNSPKDGGISRKISDGDTRKRLKEMLAELKLARGMSVIIRTAGMDRTRAEIRRDFEYLVKLWNRIREDTLSSTAPALIYEESDLIKRSIRDLYTNDIEEVVVEGDAAYKSAREFMKLLLPSHTPRVKHYKENTPLFYAFNIEDQLLSMHDPVVKLRSGGYIVLNPTEALISIDVNSGRSTGERNIEETATKTNLEAAAEIARQLRLRDLAGLIVIDFIDMMESRNRRGVERALREALKTDRAKIQLGRISPFGLLEMSRQRLRPSISEANMVSCPHCQGRGSIRSGESLSIQIIRALEKDAATGNWQTLKLSAPEAAALYLLNHKRALLATLEERYGIVITVVIDHALSTAAFTIEKVRRAGPVRAAETQERAPRETGREERGGRRRRGRDRDREPPPAVEAVSEMTAEAELEDTGMEAAASAATEETAGADEDAAARGRRRRGRRGGRGRGGNRQRPATESADVSGADAGEEINEATVQEAPAETVKAAPGQRPRRGSGSRSQSQNQSGSRRRWRGREETRTPEEAHAEPNGRSTPMAAPMPVATDAQQLPAFTRRSVVEPLPVAEESPPRALPPREAAVHSLHQPISAPQPAEQGPRKGWWQRIIELD